MELWVVDNRGGATPGNPHARRKSSMTDTLVDTLTIAASNFNVRVLREIKDLEHADINNVKAIILSGSSLSLMNPADIPSARLGMVVLTKALAHKIPTLGICFGMQLMAYMMGGELIRLRKRQVYTVNNMYFNHETGVMSCPGFEMVKHVDNYAFQIQSESLGWFGTQWHPEGTKVGKDWLLQWVNLQLNKYLVSKDQMTKNATTTKATKTT